MDTTSKQQILDLVANMYDQDSAAITKVVRDATSDLRDSYRTAAIQNNVTDLEDRRRLFHDYLPLLDTRGVKATVEASGRCRPRDIRYISDTSLCPQNGKLRR